LKYNARGERVAKITPSTGISDYNFVYDEAGHLLGEYGSTGGTRREYVWLDDILVAVIAVTDGSAAGYLVAETDHLGTPRALIDPVRNVAVWRWSVIGSAFGDHADETDPDANGAAFWFNLRFPGQYTDGFGRTYYNYLRDYDAWIGRYTESDPIGLAGGVSTYGYVEGNPLNAIDPLGLATYQCTRKLTNVPFRVGRLYHQYVCTGSAKDGYRCGGLGPSGNMFDSPGIIETDAYSSDKCSLVRKDDTRVENCIIDSLAKPTPNYSVGLSHGQNCQTYATGIVAACVISNAGKSRAVFTGKDK
jgi:RHS repeat-associated protein